MKISSELKMDYLNKYLPPDLSAIVCEYHTLTDTYKIYDMEKVKWMVPFSDGCVIGSSNEIHFISSETGEAYKKLRGAFDMLTHINNSVVICQKKRLSYHWETKLFDKRTCKKILTIRNRLKHFAEFQDRYLGAFENKLFIIDRVGRVTKIVPFVSNITHISTNQTHYICSFDDQRAEVFDYRHQKIKTIHIEFYEDGFSQLRKTIVTTVMDFYKEGVAETGFGTFRYYKLDKKFNKVSKYLLPPCSCHCISSFNRVLTSHEIPDQENDFFKKMLETDKGIIVIGVGSVLLVL